MVCGISRWPASSATKEQFRLARTYDIDEGFHPSLFAGKALEAVGDYENALEYYEIVRAQSKLDYLPISLHDLQRCIGICLHETGKLSRAHSELKIGKLMVDQFAQKVSSSGNMHEIVHVSVLDQALLYSEELALVSGSLGETADAKEHMDNAFEFLQMIGSSQFMRAPWIRGRLLLKRALLTGILPGDVSLADLILALEDAEEGLAIKIDVNDLQGIIDGRAILSGVHMRMGFISRALGNLHALLEDVRMLGTRPGPRLLSVLASRLAVVTLPNALMESRSGTDPLSHDAVLGQIQKLAGMLQSKALHAGVRILQDLIPLAEWPAIIAQTKLNEKGLNMEFQLRQQMARMGVGLRSTNDKRQEHIESIRLLRRHADGGDAKAAEAIEWEAFGDFYRRAGDRRSAELAYLAGEGLARQSPDHCELNRRGLQRRLARKIEELKS
jgi:tetratricopeptide (TPR) repeat protein